MIEVDFSGFFFQYFEYVKYIFQAVFIRISITIPEKLAYGISSRKFRYPTPYFKSILHLNYLYIYVTIDKYFISTNSSFHDLVVFSFLITKKKLSSLTVYNASFAQVQFISQC